VVLPDALVFKVEENPCAGSTLSSFRMHCSSGNPSLGLSQNLLHWMTKTTSSSISPFPSSPTPCALGWPLLLYLSSPLLSLPPHLSQPSSASTTLLTPLPMPSLNSILYYTIEWLVPQGEGVPAEVPPFPNTWLQLHRTYPPSLYLLINTSLILSQTATERSDLQQGIFIFEKCNHICEARSYVF